MPEKQWLRLPVVSAGAEHLVMGYLMRRNILAYKAQPNNEGYDLICIHPDPRHCPKKGELAQVRVQVPPFGSGLRPARNDLSRCRSKPCLHPMDRPGPSFLRCFAA